MTIGMKFGKTVLRIEVVFAPGEKFRLEIFCRDLDESTVDLSSRLHWFKPVKVMRNSLNSANLKHFQPVRADGLSL